MNEEEEHEELRRLGSYLNEYIDAKKTEVERKNRNTRAVRSNIRLMPGKDDFPDENYSKVIGKSLSQLEEELDCIDHSDDPSVYWLSLSDVSKVRDYLSEVSCGPDYITERETVREILVGEGAMTSAEIAERLGERLEYESRGPEPNHVETRLDYMDEVENASGGYRLRQPKQRI